MYKNNKLSDPKYKQVKQKYENLIKNVSITEYAQMICGNQFQDIIISTSEIPEFSFTDLQQRIEDLNFNNNISNFNKFHQLIIICLDNNNKIIFFNNI